MHISDVRESLKVAKELAQNKLKSSQGRMKLWYDKKARSHTFQPGDRVLVLLPMHGQPLQARYCGPYTVEQKVNEVNYLVKTPGREETVSCELARAIPGREGNETPVMVAMNCVTKNDELDATTQECEETGRSPQLKNSDVLLKLDQKLRHLSVQEKEMLKELLGEFAILFLDVPGKTSSAIHDVDVGYTPPIKQHPYRVNPMKLKLMRNEIDYMLQNGIIEPSQSQWSSPCVLVPKSDGTYRFYTGFRKINGVSKSDSYRVDDCIDRIGHAKYVSKFDLLKGYWQVPLTKRAQELSAFVTPDGLFQYRVMPFGMKNVPATFQRMMNSVTSGLEGCDAYIDDPVLYSGNWEDHIQLLRKFFGRLQDAHLTVNLSKSEFCRARVVFLGHIVDQGEVAPVASKVDAIVNFPTLEDKREVMRFLGMTASFAITSPLLLNRLPLCYRNRESLCLLNYCPTLLCIMLQLSVSTLSSISFIPGALIYIIIDVLFCIKYSNLLSFDSLKYLKYLSGWGLCPQTHASNNSILMLEPPFKKSWLCP